MYRSSEHLHQLKTIKKFQVACISTYKPSGSIHHKQRQVSFTVVYLASPKCKSQNYYTVLLVSSLHQTSPLPLSPPFPLMTSLFFLNSSSDLSRLTSCLVASATKHVHVHACTCRRISFKCLFPSSLSLR